MQAKMPKTNTVGAPLSPPPLSWIQVVLHISSICAVAIVQLLMFPCVFVILSTFLYTTWGLVEVCSAYLSCESKQASEHLSSSYCTLSGRVRKRVQLSTVNVMCLYQMLYLWLFLSLHRDSGAVCSDMVRSDLACPNVLDKLFTTSSSRNLWYIPIINQKKEPVSLMSFDATGVFHTRHAIIH
jgi:hypothetical protein